MIYKHNSIHTYDEKPKQKKGRKSDIYYGYIYLVAYIPIDIDYHITIHINNSTTNNTTLESLID